MNIRETSKDFFMLYLNEYITVEKIAEHFGISVELAKALVSDGRKISNNWHPEQ